MTQEQKRAHERLLAVLPCRTHKSWDEETAAERHRVRLDNQVRQIKKQVTELQAQGMKAKHMAAKIGCSIQTVYNHLRRR
jgi:hypothetical protein